MPIKNDTTINQTQYTQPALFAFEYALAQIWLSGIKPHAVMGHSVGEYVAACVAGVFTLEDGLRLIAERARLMGGLPQTGRWSQFCGGESHCRYIEAIYESSFYRRFERPGQHSHLRRIIRHSNHRG
ncbi:MAG: acyltransferase domain-containing protein [Anaerolineales bacterium]